MNSNFIKLDLVVPHLQNRDPGDHLRLTVLSIETYPYSREETASNLVSIKGNSSNRCKQRGGKALFFLSLSSLTQLDMLFQSEFWSQCSRKTGKHGLAVLHMKNMFLFNKLNMSLQSDDCWGPQRLMRHINRCTGCRTEKLMVLLDTVVSKPYLGVCIQLQEPWSKNDINKSVHWHKPKMRRRLRRHVFFKKLGLFNLEEMTQGEIILLLPILNHLRRSRAGTKWEATEDRGCLTRPASSLSLEMMQQKVGAGEWRG